MSSTDAYAFANCLATTLMIPIIIFRAGDGTLSVIPCNEFDGDADMARHRSRKAVTTLDRRFRLTANPLE